ncbi:MAG: hypothetical protein Q9181_004803 [Wetmoreana brouardii]
MTITVQKPEVKRKKAGDTDVSVAERVLSFAHTRWVDEDNQVRKDRYERFAEVMEAAVAGMTPDREVVWWERPADTAKNEMEYTCDNERAGPVALDCLKLQYHGLGKGTVDLRPLTLTWEQISAAFDTLLNLCVDQTPLPPKGGHATFSAHPDFKLFGRKRRKSRRDDAVTGLNSLPEGAIINVWNHSENANMACELRAVLKGQPMGQCAAR